MCASSPKFSPDTVIDEKYRIERLIGSGGMGEVYEATQLAIERRVALKTLRAEFAQNKNAVARFHQEARLAGSFGHDHICEVTDLGKHEDTIPYLVMPLLSGNTLAELMKKENLPLLRLIDIVCQILSALTAAHRAKIVHRDLKPSNVLITKVGNQEDFVKLLDFGISKVLDAEERSNITKTGAVPGTSFYMSPEQAIGSRNIDYRVDIYAVGVILYEALTGILPFDGDSHNEVMHKIITASFTVPHRINPTVPKSLEQVVLKAMARDPHKRYADAEAMREALERTVVDGMTELTAQGTATHTAPRTPPWTPFAPVEQREQTTDPLVSRATGFSRQKMIISIGFALLLIGVSSFSYLTYRAKASDESVVAPVGEPDAPSAPAAIDMPPVVAPAGEPAETPPPLTQQEMEPKSETAVLTGAEQHAEKDETPEIEKKSEPLPSEAKRKTKGKRRPVKKNQKKKRKIASDVSGNTKNKTGTGKEGIQGRFGAKIFPDYGDE